MARDGSSKIFLQVHGTPTVQQYATRSGVTYVFSNCRVPVYNNRHPLLTQYFNTPVADAALRQMRTDVQLRIDLRAPAVPTARLIELVPGKTVMLEVTFPAGNYYHQIPTSDRLRPARPKSYPRSAPHGTKSRHGRTTSPSNDSRSSVLGPAVP